MCSTLVENIKFSAAEVIKASPIKSFVHNDPPKIFLTSQHQLTANERKQQKQQKQNSTAINNCYFLVLNYLESWLNLLIVSMFVLKCWQVGDIQNRKP